MEHAATCWQCESVLPPDRTALLRVQFIATALVSCLIACSTTAADSSLPFDGELYEKRTKYLNALSAVRNGRQSEFNRLKNELSDYALHPYLVYHDASRQIRSLNTRQVSGYRERLAGTPLDDLLFQRWQLIQGQRGRWQRLANAFEGSENTETVCYFGQALLHVNRVSEAMELVPKLWVVGESQPKACDSLFAAWMRAGHLTEDLAWKRLRLALEGNSRSLARYLLRFFSEPRLSRARQFYEVHVNPARTRTSSYFPDDQWGREGLAHGLKRHARSHLDKAEQLWKVYRERYAFSEADRLELDDSFERLRAQDRKLPAHVQTDRTPETIGAIVDAAVALREWDSAWQWLGTMPDPDAQEFKWQYWRGRIAYELALPDAPSLLDEIASVRTYYGFAAAAVLGAPPSMNELSVPDSVLKSGVERHPGVARLLELLAVGDLVNAKREWKLLAADLALEDKLAVAALLNNAGWTDQAIFAANAMGLHDVIAVRFPLEYERNFRKASFATSVDLPFLFAIARQESAFMPKAKSRVGALGIMQMMPATARSTARRVTLPDPSATRLLDPSFNIPLGAHHLAELLEEFDGNRAIAAAAYNAGRKNARRWLNNSSGMDTVAWIERITYFETRNYVKNVLAFSMVYAHQLGVDRPFLFPHELIVR